MSKRKKPPGRAGGGGAASASLVESDAKAEVVRDDGASPASTTVTQAPAKRARGGKAAAKSAPAGGVTEEVAPEVEVARRDDPRAEPEDAAPPLQDDDFGDAYENDLEDGPTVNLAGNDRSLPGRDDLDEPTVSADAGMLDPAEIGREQRRHLRGLLEALVFASDVPIKSAELAKLAGANVTQVKDTLAHLQRDYVARGIQLDEIAGGWVFRTNAQFAPFVRDLTKQKPVRLSRAQVETMAIIAYRQPITRPEIDDVRGVDSGPVLKVLLERDLIRILGKRDEVGRPIIYGTTSTFLEFFGLKSLKDLPTLREFTELTEESRDAYEDEMGEAPNDAPPIAEPFPTQESPGASAPAADDDEETADVARAEVEIEPAVEDDDADESLDEDDDDEDDEDDDDDDDDDEDDDDDDDDDDEDEDDDE